MPTLLSPIPFFKNLPEADLEAILAAGSERAFPAGSFLFYQDDPAERVYVLKSGRVKLASVAADGQQVLMQVMTPGRLFAAISLVKGAVYPVTAEAAEDSLVIGWPQQVMLDLMQRYPPLALNALEVLAGHVRDFKTATASWPPSGWSAAWRAPSCAWPARPAKRRLRACCSTCRSPARTWPKCRAPRSTPPAASSASGRSRGWWHPAARRC